MTDQGSEMVSLLQGVKLEKPRSFTGVIDMDAKSAFIFHIKYYFALTNILDAKLHARFASILLTNSTAVWLQS